ncbi:MAG: low molecular weight protein-tyrosine-phosphatase [Saprospiraceae bacterium]|nr:low molecular weight protein-tyrosine-phosphatase [Saprospiraceae bacterium]
MKREADYHIIMVCLGNICRSPLAEGILRRKADARGLNISVDSAGTSDWHEGEPPDPRSVEIARKKGLDISGQRSRPFSTEDFEKFDLILCMDKENLQNVLSLTDKDAHRTKVELMLAYLEEDDLNEVPDPYWGGGFDHVFELLDRACSNLCDELAKLPDVNKKEII